MSDAGPGGAVRAAPRRHFSAAFVSFNLICTFPSRSFAHFLLLEQHNDVLHEFEFHIHLLRSALSETNERASALQGDNNEQLPNVNEKLLCE